MSVETLRLKLHKDGDTDSGANRIYDIEMIQSVNISSTKEAFSIAPPGLSSSDNILLGISGMQADISIDFKIYDDGTDKSAGTAGNTVVGVTRQIKYLENTMQSPDFGVAWEIDHINGTAFSEDDVFFESFEVPIFDRNSPKWKPATIRLRRGGSV